jgi:membrane protease YdiL (CAAX protease family)
MTRIVDIFFGPDKLLRPIWRAFLYFLLTFVALPFLLDPAVKAIFHWAHMRVALTPSLVALGDGESFIVALIATGLFAWYEARRIDSYFMPVGEALSRRTWEGAAAGVLLAGGVGLGIYLLGGMQVHELALSGVTLLSFAIAWVLAMMLVGIAEEFWFRAYFLETLWKAIGFWPASLIIAAIFAAIHYFFKTGENVWDVITLVWFSLLICYSVLKTGSLWFAVGLHFAFDYMQFFVIGTPNGAMVPQGRLLDVTFNGPAWLTGGVLGTEASFLMYPLLALLTLYVWWRDPPADAGKQPA